MFQGSKRHLWRLPASANEYVQTEESHASFIRLILSILRYVAPFKKEHIMAA